MVGNDNRIMVDGTVTEVLPDTRFRIELATKGDHQPIILGHLAGKLRVHRIKILAGDRVQVELSPYNLTQGRIVKRY